ncbi:MAG TPA: ATP-binding protein [Candidatus Saccharimonadales bacterium]|nr:ATP-binding protein [Candidatus Saccharimonadales bacterium]
MSVKSSSPADEQKTSVALERKKAESDALFLSIGEGAIVTDEQGKISRVNQVALDILGYTAADLLGKWYPQVIVAEDEDERVIPNIHRPITSVFLTGRPVSARVYYRRRDGTKIIVFLTVSPVILDGRPMGAIEVFRNITREVELERAKDEFISLASHQLRTPATAVKQYAAMLIQGYAGELTDEQRAMAQTIYDCNERQITIVNDLLRVAQVDAGQVRLRPEDIDIVATIKSIIDDQASKFTARRQQVRYDSPPEKLRVQVDPQLMRMVIENIVDNASKYTPKGKNIEVSLRPRKTHVAIHIKDEGVGMDTKDIPRVFQKFSRLQNPLSNSVSGTGLGLYWAKKIVDLHGGTIKVRSKTNKGTTFTIQIPLAVKSG